MKRRAIILIIDACGVGSMPDWSSYDEVAPSNTLKSTCAWMQKNLRPIQLPNLQKLGIANIDYFPGLEAVKDPQASYGKMSELNNAKDTITGHWEMCGVKAKNAFPYYPNGFPNEVLEEFKKQTGVTGILSNAPASGTTVINELGDKHSETGFPIIYTSADSVLQIACDIDVVPLKTLYKWCEIAREIMRGEHEVARIIARPFHKNPDWVATSPSAPRNDNLKAADMKYIRLGDKRHDYSVLPHGKSILETVLDHGGHVIGLGKIQDIFAGVGVPENIHTDNNADGLNKLIHVLKESQEGVSPKITQGLQTDKEIIFINLVETDSNYGHRRDPEGFAKALEEIDKRIPEVLSAMTENDILLISADHGCDPTAAGSDHTREYVPIISYSKNLPAKNLNTRNSFADIGATILDWFSIKDSEIPIQATTMLTK